MTVERGERRGTARGARRLLVALATLVLLPLLAELVSRAVADFEGPLQPLRVGSIQLFGRHDARLFWSLDPGATDADGRPWINAAGLRGPELEPKAPGVRHVLSLGESTTFAAQMEYERCYSAVLERLLARRDGAAPVRVLNGGVPGYSLFQGVRFLLERSAPLEPDLVLLYFGFNDFLPVAYLGERTGDPRDALGGRTDRELFEARQAPLERLRGWLLAHSNLARGLLGGGPREQAGAGSPDASPQLGGRPRVPAEDRRQLLELAVAETRRRGIQLVIVVPFYREFEEHAPLLRELAAREGVPIADLPAVLPERLERPRASYFFDPVHPTPQGHRLIAEAILEVVDPLLP